MPRTPLARHLRRALALARVANVTGVPAAELADLERSGALATRRELLRASAVAGAGLALGCSAARRPAPAPGGPAPAAGREVAIVGAGIAGLTCAWRLRQAGVAARVFEGQKRVGGRMWSLVDRFPEGQVCELGGELVDTGHATLRGLCAELGVELDDFEQEAPDLARDIWFFGGRRVADAEVVEAFRPVAARIDEAWASLSGETVGYRAPNGGEAIDRLSLAEWLTAAGAAGWFYDLLDVAYTTEYGLEIAEQSPWNLLQLIDSDPDPFRVFGASDERFHLRGGNDQLPARLAERLTGALELDHRLVALGQAADGSYRLTFERGGATREVAAEHVVLTLPFTTLREVRLDLPLSEVKRRAIAELGYGTNAKLMVGFAERVWRTRGGSNGSVLTDLGFQLSWESTRLQPGTGGIVVAYGGGRHGVELGRGTAAEQAARFAGEFERVFPGAAAQRTTEVRFHWPSFPWVKGSYACYRPGQWTTISGAEGERAGNLHFAGEHTSLDFQGYMEGGAESGARAASEILADLGLAAAAPAAARSAAGGRALFGRRELLAALG